jgi:DNA-binding transcriptional MocR family regulator
MNAINTHLVPLGFSLPQPSRDVVGGYFAWLTLPTDLRVSAKTLAKKCMDEEKVIIAGGNIFEVPGDNGMEETRFDRNVRLCWAWEEEWKLEEAVKRVALVVKSLLEEGGGDESRESEEFVVVEKQEQGVLEDFK